MLLVTCSYRKLSDKIVIELPSIEFMVDLPSLVAPGRKENTKQSDIHPVMQCVENGFSIFAPGFDHLLATNHKQDKGLARGVWFPSFAAKIPWVCWEVR